MSQSASIVMLNSIKPQIFLILRAVATVFNGTSETFNVFFYFIGFLFVSLLGVFIVIFLLSFSIIFVYNILYYLISKIDCIYNKRNQEFALIEKKKFIFYIIKYLFFIIFMAFFSYLINKLILNEFIYLDNIINNFYMSFYWLSFMLFFYSYIYFFESKKFLLERGNIKIYVLLFIYRFLVFFILRAILYILCPEEYTIFLSQGLVSILLYPNLILVILNRISEIYSFVIELSPGIMKAEAEEIKFEDYLKEKYESGNPQRDLINYPRLMDIPKMPPLPRAANLSIEDLFYLPPILPENILLEEYTIFEARKAHKKHCLYLTELREVNFMCSGSDALNVSMPVFIKYMGMLTNDLPDNYIRIHFKDRSEIYIYIGQRDVINYIISENVYTIKPEGNRENYSPLYLWHLHKKIYVDKLNGEGVLIGNSRGRIFTKDNAIALYQHALLKERYNIKRMTD